MIAGLGLAELAEQVIAESRSKRDFMVASQTATFEMTPVGDSLRPFLSFEVEGKTVHAGMTDFAFRQLTEFGGIPAKYVDKMQAKLPDLVAQNVNAWLMELAEKRMIRMFEQDGVFTARAFLSSKYNPLDYYDLFTAIAPVLKEKNLKVMSSKITDSRLYIQALREDVVVEIERARKLGGHTIGEIRGLSPGVVIANSEVGAGSLRVETFIYDRYCTNGCIWGDLLKRNHVGRNLGGDGDTNDEYLTDDTKKLRDAAFWSTIKDVVGGSLDEAKFRAIVGKMESTGDVELPDINCAIKATGEKFGLTQNEQDDVLRALVAEGDATQFGLFNAVTRAAQDAKSYDRAVEMERIGGNVARIDRAEIARWVN